WAAPIYQFFKEPVLRFNDDGCPYHWFACDSKTCKSSGLHGVKCYADKSDSSGTKNLKWHATSCFGTAMVEAAEKAKVRPVDGSITAAFGWQSSMPAPNKPFTISTICNRPVHLVTDRKFVEITVNGRPGLDMPSQSTIARDIKTAFDHSLFTVSARLKKYPGKLSFTTDAWTSPNHRAFVAWTVHLQHESQPLDFLLDVFEVPSSHTGEALASAF
ncbi:hypothetical protein C8J56DRAFT_762794, partial [Mycena floridula]